MKIYSITDRYINYLRDYDSLNNVLYNKEENRKHTRKHLSIGILLSKGKQKYYIPFSSSKDNDYIIDNIGNQSIKRSTLTIHRLVNDSELLGKLKLSAMIPVPKSELMLYDLNKETDIKYKDLVKNQLDIIEKDFDKILKKAKTLYNQKINADKYFKDNKPKYIEATVDFKFAEEKCKEWEQKHIEKVISEYDKRQKEIDIER